MDGWTCGDIRHLADISGHGLRDDLLVEIWIRLDDLQPPAGWVALASEVRAEEGPAKVSLPSYPFIGWLGLVKTLDEFVTRAVDSG